MSSLFFSTFFVKIEAIPQTPNIQNKIIPNIISTLILY